jgi:chemotaxis protein MotB
MLLRNIAQSAITSDRLVSGVLAALCLLAVLPLSGCVSSSTYDQLNQRYQGVSQERDALSKQVNALQGNTRLLQNKVETTQEQNTRIKANLARTEAQLTAVNKELAARNNELKQTNEELHTAKGRLNEKNTQLAATSAELQRRQQELQSTMQKLDASHKKLKATADYMSKTNKLYDDLVKELSSEVDAKQIKIKEMKDGISVNLSEDILFPSGSAQLNQSGQQVIKKVSSKLKDIPHQIIVAGFTDNVPFTGALAKTYPTNWELAGARAASVVRLLAKTGVDSKKLTAVSFGENDPVASNKTAVGRSQNRRIEIRLRPVK